MTLPFVPGGPDPSRNGFSNFIPLTVIDRSAVTSASRVRVGERVGLTQGARAIQPGFSPIWTPRNHGTGRAMKTITHWIDGKTYDKAAERHGDVFNPATGEVQSKVAFASPSVVDEAVESAARASQTWR